MASMNAITVPDIGDFTDVPVIEILVSPGDTVAENDPLIVLESDKATLEVPSPSAGVVDEITVSVGDTVSQGDPIVTLRADGDAADGGDDADADADADDASESAADDAAAESADASSTDDSAADSEAPDDRSTPEEASADDSDNADEKRDVDDADTDTSTSETPSASAEADESSSGDSRDLARTPRTPAPANGTTAAGPAARRVARELGLDLAKIEGTGRAGRITVEDVARAARDAGQGAGNVAVGLLAGLPEWPTPDFSAHGPVERVPRSRIARIAGPSLARNWVAIPHVTQFDEADITDLEAFRKEVNAAHQADGVKVTMVALLLKACSVALREFPTFNSSLDGDDLILKRYFHLGFAADTPAGLMVPVIRDVDRKGLLEIARELTTLSGAARDGSIRAEQMQGGTFTISSLGGIGGTAFTPIINAPEVAILGVSRSRMAPVWNGRSFAPRLMLPLSLSYDHRVIDGAQAARFTTRLAELLGDPREMLL